MLYNTGQHYCLGRHSVCSQGRSRALAIARLGSQDDYRQRSGFCRLVGPRPRGLCRAAAVAGGGLAALDPLL